MIAVIINEELFCLEDQCQQVVQRIRESEIFRAYLISKRVMNHSDEVEELKKDFLTKKASFEQIADYGKYAPDFREKQRAVRAAKRKLDLTDEVSEFRVNETQLQGILDEIGQQLASGISSEIKINAGSPFFETSKHAGCGGNCHAS